MPLNPDDALALEEFDAEQAAPKRGPANGFVAENRLKWLRRVVGDLKARVDELEAGPIDSVIAAKDAIIAMQDKCLALHAERIATLEAVKLPHPTQFYRDQLPLVAVTPVSEVPSVTDEKVSDATLSNPEIVATDEKTQHDLNRHPK
jgi:hypothetical protein